MAGNGREWLRMARNGKEWPGMAGNGWEWQQMAGNVRIDFPPLGEIDHIFVYLT
jgi:hypothetical protein